jgi:hypothetical protein
VFEGVNDLLHQLGPGALPGKRYIPLTVIRPAHELGVNILSFTTDDIMAMVNRGREDAHDALLVPPRPLRDRGSYAILVRMRTCLLRCGRRSDGRRLGRARPRQITRAGRPTGDPLDRVQPLNRLRSLNLLSRTTLGGEPITVAAGSCRT